MQHPNDMLVTFVDDIVAAMMSDKRAPEFLQALPITKTRAGMQVLHYMYT